MIYEEVVTPPPVIGQIVAPGTHSISHRRTLGAFYTPMAVSRALAKWGIRSSEDAVLEPCFGGCTFLEAAVERLGSFGHSRPTTNLFGCDVDPLAFEYLKARVPTDGLISNFFQQDFMSFHFQQIGRSDKVDLVIGNPPYIGHGKFTPAQRGVLAAWRERYGVSMDLRASLWAYFVIHALHFLRPGGRIAWVLPGSFLHAKYAVPIRESLRSSFRDITAVTVAERLFVSEGTEETTVVLLADGYRRPPATNYIATTCVDSVDDFVALMNDSSTAFARPVQIYPGHGMVPDDACASHEKMAQADSIVNLGDIAALQIGLVSGDSRFFIKSKSEWAKEQIESRHLQYILPQSKWVPGAKLNAADVKEQIGNNVRCLALACPPVPRARFLVRYLNTYGNERIKANATFGKRTHWYRFIDDKTPDGFLVFMASIGPRIILNFTSSNATNAVYRMYFKSNVSATMRKLAAISIHSTFSQLSAEIVGHARGSGALKLEPSSAHKIQIAMPKDLSDTAIEDAFGAIDKALRNRSWENARKIADDLLFKGEGFSSDMLLLAAGLATVRNRRMRK